jgi:DAACS family dicarboxylate/amino acid:cation (Na+ or H+) symporter
MTRPDEDPTIPTVQDEPESRPGGIPLYVWVLLAVALAIPVGMALGLDARRLDGWPAWGRTLLKVFATALVIIPQMLIKGLGALAGPLVVLAILSAIVTNEIHGRQGARMMVYYLINTLLAMVFGLVLSNAIGPGAGVDLNAAAAPGRPTPILNALVPPPPPSRPEAKTLVQILTEIVPRSVGDALAQNNLAQLVLLTIAASIALAKVRDAMRARGEHHYQVVVDLVTVGFDVLMKVLLWVVALVPLAVFGVVATSVAREGFGLFLRLGWFIVAVLLGLACQVALYLVELGVFARLGPARFLRASADVMASTFSTASTAATIPFTLKALTDRLGVSRASSQLAACVGTNFNNDGTALYQASAALFFAQASGANLTVASQIIVVMTTLIASVGAGGIPSGSFVTMPLIFAAVGIPAEGLPLLLTIDWLLDRCRTTSNVLGDMTVAVLLDRTAEPAPAAGASPAAAAPLE